MKTYLASFIATLVQFVKADAIQHLLPDVAAFFNSIASNPSETNILAQLAELEVKLLADGTGVGQDILKEVATLVSTEATALLASTNSAAAATAAATAPKA